MHLFNGVAVRTLGGRGGCAARMAEKFIDEVLMKRKGAT